MVLYELRNEDWWLSNWKRLGIACDEIVLIDTSNPTLVKDQLYRVIQKHENLVREEFIVRARESESRIIYSQLTTNLMEKNYFHDQYSYKEISLLFKARCELLGLNGSPHNGSFHQFCSLCNLRAKEDCFHFLSICPIFTAQRLVYFGKRTLSMQETIVILNDFNWKDLYNYLKEISTYRRLLITEFI